MFVIISELNPYSVLNYVVTNETKYDKVFKSGLSKIF